MKNRGHKQRAWEAKCKQCGKCCYHKIYYVEEDEYELDVLHCKHLDPATNRCTIYETRFIINPECIKLTPVNTRLFRWLPEDCGYKHSD